MRTQFFPAVTFVLFSLVSLCLNVTANQELCELPPVTGPCRAAFPRWYYNSTAGKCLEFTYGGCMGNANNFDTDSNCTITCAPSVVAQKDVVADEKTVRTYMKLVKDGVQPEIPVPFFSVNKRFRRTASKSNATSEMAASNPTDRPRQQQTSKVKGNNGSEEKSTLSTPEKNNEEDDGNSGSEEKSTLSTRKKNNEQDDGNSGSEEKSTLSTPEKNNEEDDGNSGSEEKSTLSTPKAKKKNGNGYSQSQKQNELLSSKSDKQEDQNKDVPPYEDPEENYSLNYGKNRGIYRGSDPLEHTSSHFAAFFLTAIVMVFAAYVVYHNRQKIIAIVIEGQNNSGRRRGYRKLETNVEEAMPSMKSTANSTYVY